MRLLKNKFFLLFLLIFSVVIITLIIFYLNSILPFQKLDRKDIRVDNVKVLGDLLSVRKGRVFREDSELNPQKNLLARYKYNKTLRLALLYQITIEDPLFTGPGVEADNLSESLQTLKETQDDLLNKMESNDNIIAVDFLEKVTEVFKSEELFKKDISKKNAKKLINSYKKANNLYHKEADNLEKKLKELIGESQENQILIMFGSTTSKEIILGNLTKIKNNSSYIEKEIKKREQILKGLSDYQSNIVEIPSEKPKIENVDITPSTLLSKEELYFLKEDPKDIRGPYLINTSCWTENNIEESQLIFEEKENNQDVKGLFPKLGSTNYYLWLSEDDRDIENREVTEGYLGRNLTYRAQPENTPYACADLEYHSKIATIDSFYNSYKENRLFEKFMTLDSHKSLPEDFKDLVKEGENIERLFFDLDKYPSEDRINNLAEFYLYAYKYLLSLENKDQNFDNNWSEDNLELKDQLIYRYLFITRNLANFDLVLNYLNYYLNSYKRIYALTNTEDSNKGDYIYFNRNAYSLTFLSFTPSVWKDENQKMNFVLEGTDLMRDKKRVKKYSEMLEEFGQDVVLSINKVKRIDVLNELESSE